MKVEIHNKGDENLTIVSTTDSAEQIATLKVNERVTVEADMVELVNGASDEIAAIPASEYDPKN